MFVVVFVVVARQAHAPQQPRPRIRPWMRRLANIYFDFMIWPLNKSALVGACPTELSSTTMTTMTTTPVRPSRPSQTCKYCVCTSRQWAHNERITFNYTFKRNLYNILCMCVRVCSHMRAAVVQVKLLVGLRRSVDLMRGPMFVDCALRT